MAYEGMRGLNGPFLATLGASGAAVGVIAGGGELIGYLLRLASGRVAEKTGAYWLIAVAGYVLQMAAVPALALAGNWQAAAFFIVLERSGKALRNPAVNLMLSRAGKQIGQGWAFGLHEAMDQTGACGGPLIAALVLSLHGDYRAAFLWLGVPAALTVMTVIAVRLRFGYAGQSAQPAGDQSSRRLPRAFWIYAAASALVGFGFADYPLIAFHFAKAAVVSPTWIPIFYAMAMGASGAGSLLFGRWYDARGTIVLVPGFVVGALVAPLVFYGGFGLALAGVLLWGISQGVHDAVMNAALSNFVPEAINGRAPMACSRRSTASPGSRAAPCWGFCMIVRLAGAGRRCRPLAPLLALIPAGIARESQAGKLFGQRGRPPVRRPDALMRLTKPRGPARR